MGRPRPVITSVPCSVCFLCPSPRLSGQLGAGDEQPLAAIVGSGGILSLDTAYSHGQVQSEDAHAGLPKPQTQKPGADTSGSLFNLPAFSPGWESGSLLFWSPMNLWDCWGEDKHCAPHLPTSALCLGRVRKAGWSQRWGSSCAWLQRLRLLRRAAARL